MRLLDRFVAQWRSQENVKAEVEAYEADPLGMDIVAERWMDHMARREEDLSEPRRTET